MILNSSKRYLLVISTLIILIYLKDVYADNACKDELHKAGFKYNSGIKNYKINVLLMSETDAQTLNLLHEAVTLSNKEKTKNIQIYMKNNSELIEKRKVYFRSSDKINTTLLYFNHLEDNYNTPRLMQDSETYCALQDCTKKFKSTYFASYGYFLDASYNTAHSSLCMFKVYHAQLYNAGYIYDTGKLNYEQVAKRQGEYSTIPMRYNNEITRKYGEGKLNLLRSPITWTMIEVCRDELHKSDFKFGTAAENFQNRIEPTASLDDPKNRRISGYAAKYNAMLIKLTAVFKNDDDATKHLQQGLLHQYLAMDMNWCGFEVCRSNVSEVSEKNDDLRKAGFKGTVDKNRKEIIPQMSQYDVDLSTEFIKGYYYQIKDYDDEMDTNRKAKLEKPMDLEEWCTKQTIYTVSPYYN